MEAPEWRMKMTHELMQRSDTTSFDEASSEVLDLLTETRNYALRSWGNDGTNPVSRARVINEKLCITFELLEITVWLNHRKSHDHDQRGLGPIFPHEDMPAKREYSADIRTDADQWLPKELRSIRDRMHRLYPRLVGKDQIPRRSMKRVAKFSTC